MMAPTRLSCPGFSDAYGAAPVSARAPLMLTTFPFSAPASPQSLRQLADVLAQRSEDVLARWRARVNADPQVASHPRMTRQQFYDHISLLLDALCCRLRDDAQGIERAQDQRQGEVAEQHSQHRWQQGYNLPSLVREWGHLNACLIELFDELGAQTPTLATAAARARALWSETLTDNLTAGISEYESLLQIEASARLHNLETTLQAVRAMEVERGQLLRQVSHDLRGGLSMVAGASSLLGSQNIEAESREQIVSILQGGVRSITQMLGDLLDMSRLEAGQEQRVTAPCDVAQLLLELCSASRSLAQEKGLWLHAQGEPSLLVEGDATKIQRIAQNLLLNALKYTREGGVTLSWSSQANEQWGFSVSDTGPGLSRPNAPPIARELAQATRQAEAVGSQAATDGLASDGAAPTRDAAPKAFAALPTAGEGIGLSIVKRLCELLEATIELESEAGQGSTFRVVLPRAYPFNNS